MKRDEMQKRIDELERRVRDLEARPIYHPPVYVPVPVWPAPVAPAYPVYPVYPTYPAPNGPYWVTCGNDLSVTSS